MYSGKNGHSENGQLGTFPRWSTNKLNLIWEDVLNLSAESRGMWWFDFETERRDLLLRAESQLFKAMLNGGTARKIHQRTLALIRAPGL